CFVEHIELHYGCPLTEAGITLVDTPGADSINARHTGVAFNYIKNADAILFVTYYNHAFSQADREFLNQLGRVKDSFELDKMFFVINAADLASSEDELTEVMRHVETNLLQHGIRKPRLHALSSIMALDSKVTGASEVLAQSRFEPFEQHFYRFIYEELAELIVRAAASDASRAAASLRQWIRSAQQNEEEKRAYSAKLQQWQQELEPKLAIADLKDEIQSLQKEVEELIYYVKQRVMFRFGEF